MRQWIAIVASVGLVAVSLPFLRRHDGELSSALSKRAEGQAVIVRKVEVPPLQGVDLTRIEDRGDVATAPAYGNRHAELSVVPRYQRAAMTMLRNGRMREGAIVVTDVKTGKVLVWASHSEEGAPHDVAAEASAPSASVFKVVTSTALLEAGVTPNTRECYLGGEHGVQESDLVYNKKRDKYCATMSQALGRSLNIVFARMAKNNLDRDGLTKVARRLGYLDKPTFDVDIAPSTLDLPEDDLGFARTAAGFWSSTLSPFEAANMMTTVANGGDAIRLSIVNSVSDEAGELYRGPTAKQVIRHAMDKSTAAALTGMLEETVRNGTAYSSFHDKKGRAYLPDIRVAGKTGTLIKRAEDGPYYTWFVGFAPADKPEVAISVLVANHLTWHVKAPGVARDMLRVYFADQKAPGVTSPFDRKSTARR